MLLGARIILAISTGVFMVVALTVAAKISHPGKQGSAIATVLVGFNLALILGVPLGRIIAGSHDWKIIFTGVGALSLIAMLVLLLAIPRSEGEAPVPIREQLALLKAPESLSRFPSVFLDIGLYDAVHLYNAVSSGHYGDERKDGKHRVVCVWAGQSHRVPSWRLRCR